MAKRGHREVWRARTRAYARKHGLGEWFVRQIEHESAGFDPDVIAGRRSSPAGAQGIAQIMPDTAKGWGVNPLDPEAALNAAAKNMRRYVQQFGSVEKALRAYNAGPGAVEKSRGYSETNNYVRLILRGKSGGKLREPQGGDTDEGLPEIPDSSFTTKRHFTEGGGVDTKQAVVAALLGGGRNIMANLQRNLTSGEFDIPETTRTENRTTTVKGSPAVPGSNSGGGSAPRSNAKGGPVVRELFYDPVGAWDEGQRIAPIGGHMDHVHVAARSPGAARAIARRAQKMGLTVRELAPFDKVDPVHTRGSFHYSDQAFDASGDPKKMVELTNWIRKRYGLK